MSDITQIKKLLIQVVEALEVVENVGDLAEAAEAAQSRLDSLKKQGADILALHDATRAKGEADAKAMIKTAQATVAKIHADTDRDLKAKIDHAKAELENIAQQRHRLETEIAALRNRADELRLLVEQGKQEHAKLKDSIFQDNAKHAEVKNKLAELKRAI